MPTQVVNPTSVENPDVGQGGNAMTSATTTGHASSTATGSSGNSETKSCEWSGFPAVGGTITSVTLKIDHTSSGTLTGPTPGNEFALEYSVNGGGAWLSAVSRTSYTSSQGPTTFSVALSTSQDLTSVRVRDHIRGVSADPADIATASATISSIRIEVVTDLPARRVQPPMLI